jgi:5-methylcytosine-specific restriction endonuclease McrA
MAWRKPTKKEARRRDRRRRARIKLGSIGNTQDDKKVIEAIYEAARRISKCIGIQFHVDHIMPLARGGKHHPSNLQLLPAKINLRKKARIPKGLTRRRRNPR